MTLNIVIDPGNIDLAVSASTATSCLVTTLWNPHDPSESPSSSSFRKTRPLLHVYMQLFICLYANLCMDHVGSLCRNPLFVLSSFVRVSVSLWPRCVCVPNDALLLEERRNPCHYCNEGYLYQLPGSKPRGSSPYVSFPQGSLVCQFNAASLHLQANKYVWKGDSCVCVNVSTKG